MIRRIAAKMRQGGGDATMSDLYGDDIVLWCEQQADALRRRASNQLDWKNLAEEIEESDPRRVEVAIPAVQRGRPLGHRVGDVVIDLHHRFTERKL